MPVSRRCAGRSVMSRPPKRIRPASGAVNPAMQRRSVVLPQPDGPSRKKISPPATDALTSSSAVTAPNRLRKCSMLIGTIARRIAAENRLCNRP